MDKERVILDTDIGDDVDDAYALGLLLCSPEIELEAVTVNTGKVESKAAIARKMLDLAGKKETPVYKGLPGNDPEKEGKQAQWAQDYSPEGEIHDGGVVELVRRVADEPGQISIVAIGPLTNIGAASERDAAFGRNTKQTIIMGGSIVHGYDFGQKAAEYNIMADVAAARRVFNSGADLLVAPLDATNRLQISPKMVAELGAARNPVADAIIELTILCDFAFPTMHDPRACAALLHPELAAGIGVRVEISDDGMTDLAEGDPNCRVIIDPKQELLFALMWERLVQGPV